MTSTVIAAVETSLRFVSQPGEYVGGGKSLAFTATDAPFAAGIDCYENRLEVTVGPFVEQWRLSFAAPIGEKLTVGTYEMAERYPFQARGTPGFDFSGDGRGCNRSTARFVITDARYLPSGAIDRFRATFEQRCNGTSPGVTGEIQLVAPTHQRMAC